MGWAIVSAGSVVVPQSPEELWPFVTNTDRMDRAVGLPVAHVTRLLREEGGEENAGEYRLFGRAVARWIERPLEWEWLRRYMVLREFARAAAALPSGGWAAAGGGRDAHPGLRGVHAAALVGRAADAVLARAAGDPPRLPAVSAGALVKTIGDAVMGAFPDGRGALAAALAIRRGIRQLDTHGLADPARLVRVGVHAGACYAVTLSERRDYFGTAVNPAGRAQGQADGGEVVATAAAFEEAGGAALVAAEGRQAEPFAVTVKGLSAPVRLYRIACWDSPVATRPAEVAV